MEGFIPFKTVSVIFISGMTFSLIIGDLFTLLILIFFISSEFSLTNLIYNQIPEEYRSRYKSKLLALFKWICKVLQQNEDIRKPVIQRNKKYSE